MESILSAIWMSIAYNPIPIITNACDYIMRDLIVCANEDKHDDTIKKSIEDFNKRVSDCDLIKYEYRDGKHMCFYEHPDGTKSIFFEEGKNCSHKKQCLGK
tara:strand:- start:488 stop:790 length:303 start_codon:yes stop_codon:yes gene_type:complete